MVSAPGWPPRMAAACWPPAAPKAATNSPSPTSVSPEASGRRTKDEGYDFHPFMRARVTIDRRHSLNGRITLEWFFKNRRWLRRASVTAVEAAWAKRPLPESEVPLRFLLLVSKKTHKAAHERNKIRRWLRAAIAETGSFSGIEESARARNEQIVIMMRVSLAVRELKWELILNDVQETARALENAVSQK